MRTPFDSLLNIKKSPPGSIVIVKRNNSVKTDLYIMRKIQSLNDNKPSNNFRTQVKEFSFLMKISFNYKQISIKIKNNII